MDLTKKFLLGATALLALSVADASLAAEGSATQSGQAPLLSTIPEKADGQFLSLLADILEKNGVGTASSKEKVKAGSIQGLAEFQHYHQRQIIELQNDGLAKGEMDELLSSLTAPYVESIVALFTIQLDGVPAILLADGAPAVQEDGKPTVKTRYVLWIKKDSQQFFMQPGAQVDVKHLVEKLRVAAGDLAEESDAAKPEKAR